MLTGSRCCWQYRALSISRSYNSGKDFEQAIQLSLRVFSFILLLQKGQKICQWSAAKRKRRIQNIELFLSSPVINYGRNYKAIEKGTSIIIRLLGSYKSVIKPKNQWIYAKNSCCVHLSPPCAPRTRKWHNYMSSCFALAWLLAFTKSFASLVSRIVNRYTTDKRSERLRKH